MNCSVKDCTDPHYGRGYCKRHHQWKWKRGLLPPLRIPTVEERIASLVEPIPESGCSIWIGQVNNRGYGVMSVNNRQQYVHRIVFQLENGPIPNGKEVCHSCDIPACCAPTHLFLGTHLENMQDSVRKGRAKQSVKFGHDHPGAKFTPEQVAYIRSSTESMYSLACKFNCHPFTVQRCRRGETYK